MNFHMEMIWFVRALLTPVARTRRLRFYGIFVPLLLLLHLNA